MSTINAFDLLNDLKQNETNSLQNHFNLENSFDLVSLLNDEEESVTSSPESYTSSTSPSSSPERDTGIMEEDDSNDNHNNFNTTNTSVKQHLPEKYISSLFSNDNPFSLYSGESTSYNNNNNNNNTNNNLQMDFASSLLRDTPSDQTSNFINNNNNNNKCKPELPQQSQNQNQMNPFLFHKNNTINDNVTTNNNNNNNNTATSMGNNSMIPPSTFNPYLTTSNFNPNVLPHPFQLFMNMNYCPPPQLLALQMSMAANGKQPLVGLNNNSFLQLQNSAKLPNNVTTAINSGSTTCNTTTTSNAASLKSINANGSVNENSNKSYSDSDEENEKEGSSNARKKRLKRRREQRKTVESPTTSSPSSCSPLSESNNDGDGDDGNNCNEMMDISTSSTTSSSLPTNSTTLLVNRSVGRTKPKKGKTVAEKVSTVETKNLESLKVDENMKPEEIKEIKRQRRLIKNRESAQASRERKKRYLQGLETKVDNLAKENSELNMKISSLEDENTKLKEQLLKVMSGEKIEDSQVEPLLKKRKINHSSKNQKKLPLPPKSIPSELNPNNGSIFYLDYWKQLLSSPSINVANGSQLIMFIMLFCVGLFMLNSGMDVKLIGKGDNSPIPTNYVKVEQTEKSTSQSSTLRVGVRSLLQIENDYHHIPSVATTTTTASVKKPTKHSHNFLKEEAEKGGFGFCNKQPIPFAAFMSEKKCLTPSAQLEMKQLYSNIIRVVDLIRNSYHSVDQEVMTSPSSPFIKIKQEPTTDMDQTANSGETPKRKRKISEISGGVGVTIKQEDTKERDKNTDDTTKNKTYNSNSNSNSSSKKWVLNTEFEDKLRRLSQGIADVSLAYDNEKQILQFNLPLKREVVHPSSSESTIDNLDDNSGSGGDESELYQLIQQSVELLTKILNSTFVDSDKL